jgi:plastocyanin
MLTSRALLLAAAAALLAACGGGGSADGPTGTTTGTSTGSTTNAIAVRDNSFAPTATTVTPGTTVTRTRSGSNPHNVTFDDGTKSATQSAGSYQRAFASAGTYAYHCSIHGASMSGTVTVK